MDERLRQDQNETINFFKTKLLLYWLHLCIGPMIAYALLKKKLLSVEPFVYEIKTTRTILFVF